MLAGSGYCLLVGCGCFTPTLRASHVLSTSNTVPLTSGDTVGVYGLTELAPASLTSSVVRPLRPDCLGATETEGFNS